MRRALRGLLCALVPLTAAAEGPSLVLGPRGPADSFHVSGSTLAFGAGATFADRWTAEVRVAPWGGYAEALGGRSWVLGREGWFAARLRADAALTLPYLGVPDLGLAGWLTATAGVGGERFEFFLGAQAAAEGFVNPLEARFPLRALLGLRGRVAFVELQLFARGGIDVQPAKAAAYRAELGLTLGYVLGAR